MADMEVLAPGGHQHLVDKIKEQLAMKADASLASAVEKVIENQPTAVLSGTVLTASDAYAAPPMAFTVEGKSTQDGTPTPAAPVEIVSVEQVTLHASADGTTDAANWPVLLNLTHALRSLPNGTHDTLSLTYLRPSTREGWAWYERVVERGVGIVTVSAFTSYVRRTRHGSNPGCVFGIAIDAPAVNVLGYCSHGVCVEGTTATENYGQFGMAWVTHNDPNLLKVTIAPDRSSLALGNEWLAENGPITFVYKLATPVTTTLDPIELPVLPAPDVTVWSDPSTGLQMRYVRDMQIVIDSLNSEIERAYAAIAPVESTTAKSNHAVGDYLMLGGTLCKVTSAIASGETIAIGTNVTATTVDTELASLE